jgi:hypothetical protein
MNLLGSLRDAGSALLSAASRTGRLHVLVILAGVIVLAALGLSSLRVGSVEFGMQGRTRSFAVQLAAPATTGSLLVRGATIAGTRVATADPALAVAFARDDEITVSAPRGTEPITLERVGIPAAWQIRLEVGEDADLLLLAAPAKGVDPARRPTLQLLLPRGTRLIVGTADDRRSTVVPADTVLAIETDHLDLRLTQLAGPTGDLFQLLRPTALRFERDEIDYGDSGGRLLAFGTIDQGRLWVDHAAGLPAITAIDRLRLAEISSGVVRPVALIDGSISFGARGSARTITNTPAATEVDLRPTLLDPLLDNALLRVALGVFSFFASLQIANILRER